MPEIIAYCGLACHDCGAYLATVADDAQKRKDVAEQWSKEQNARIGAEEMDCLGCLTDSERIFTFCRDCEVRTCAIEKMVPNCAYCGSYVCGALEKIFAMAPEGRERLDGIRSTLPLE